jgi:hypothetical protein
LNFTDLKNIEGITQEQLDIYVGVLNEQRKTIVMWVIIGGFFLVLAVFILEIFGIIKSDWPAKTITGVLNGVLAHTMYPLVNHYFSAKSQAKKTEKKGIK